MQRSDFLTLKWGTLKAGYLNSEKGQELFQRYKALGVTWSAAAQRNTPEQTELVLQMIDECTAPQILLDWNNSYVTKDEAKCYVIRYQETRKTYFNAKPKV